MSKKSKGEATDRETTTSISKWNPAIGSLIPEDRTLVKVYPNAKLEEATTLMRAYNYSQLPVMEGERKVNGVISWKSIGSSKITQIETSEVRRYMDDKVSQQIVNETDSLIEVSHIIEGHDYVLVKDYQGVITGIVTASDLTREFRNLYEPLYLSGTVEMYLRQIIQNANFTACEFEKANMALNPIEELTLGDYYRLIGPEENWQKLNLKNVDRGVFRSALCKVKNIRNLVVHFRDGELPDGELPDEKKELLRSFSDFLKDLVDEQVKQSSP